MGIQAQVKQKISKECHQSYVFLVKGFIAYYIYNSNTIVE